MGNWSGRDWDYEEEVDLFDDEPVDRPAEPDPDGLTGTDPAKAVRVIVGEQGEVLAVRLDEQWERRIDPRELGTAVLTAAGNATALAAEHALAGAPPEPVHPQAPQPGELTPQDVIRLVDAVFADLEAFTDQLGQSVDHPVTAQSRGGHVHGEAQAGQILRLTVDSGWAASRRHTEVSAELEEVLRELRRRSAPASPRPQSPAIDELMTVARRMGMAV
ncbi:hypothetical protein Lesp02_61530 [Lentzea sp. NBRC 105346]|uniref:hypothetical protein n=1 Tax=Lentzea sp. NBRC 105346 TaxID=3032205 RepID=UPI0025545004|nr:hypothetical protein [Lentzea sp. NBRC 105346]GLZ33965.1 hypothetical protein Lesp02_61530 [Lentzea sp. NBRC 105346]